jgi:hypothetical protein
MPMTLRVPMSSANSRLLFCVRGFCARAVVFFAVRRVRRFVPSALRGRPRRDFSPAWLVVAVSSFSGMEPISFIIRPIISFEKKGYFTYFANTSIESFFIKGKTIIGKWVILCQAIKKSSRAAISSAWSWALTVNSCSNTKASTHSRAAARCPAPISCARWVPLCSL